MHDHGLNRTFRKLDFPSDNSSQRSDIVWFKESFFFFSFLLIFKNSFWSSYLFTMILKDPSITFKVNLDNSGQIRLLATTTRCIFLTYPFSPSGDVDHRCNKFFSLSFSFLPNVGNLFFFFFLLAKSIKYKNNEESNWKWYIFPLLRCRSWNQTPQYKVKEPSSAL